MRTKADPHPALADLEPLIAPGRLCLALDISFQTLERWASKGLIAAVKLPSGAVRYRASDLKRIVKGEWEHDTPRHPSETGDRL